MSLYAQRRPISAPLPAIDFPQVVRSLGDIRDVISGDLGELGRAGKFSCPFHGGGSETTPSLHVYEDHFHCYGCGVNGDALHWIALRNGLNLVQAAKLVDPSIETAEDRKVRGPSGGVEAQPQRPVPARVEAAPAAVRPWTLPGWQERVDQLVRLAEANLWSAAGSPALGWLRRRGLSDLTIRRFRLGFLPDHARVGPVAGFLDDHSRPRSLYAPRGVTIPWLAPGAWYSREDGGEPLEVPRWVGLNVRRLADDVDAPLPSGVEKCMAVAGSRRGYLYPFPTIERTQGDLPILLVEGEFDALIGNQELGHVLHVATAGSASSSVRNLSLEARSTLALAPWILLAFDHDEAGAEAVRAWREAYPHKGRRVLLPHGKDLNDFASRGGDLAAWIAEVRSRIPSISPGYN